MMADRASVLKYREEDSSSIARKGLHYVSKLLVLRSRTTLLPMSLRSRFLRALGMRIGEGCRIRHGVLLGSRHIIIGNEVGINTGTFIDGSGQVTIEDGVSIGPFVKIVTGSHEIGPSRMRRFGHKVKPVVIGEGSWLHTGCIINPGVTIAKGCVIASGAVVTKSTSPDGFYAGVPAVRIRDLS